MCIYLITNLINDKKYVGQTIYKNPNQRWSKHKYDTKRDSFCSIHMAMRKYRIENFKFEVIDESANNIDELNDLEEFYIIIQHLVGMVIPFLTKLKERCLLIGQVILIHFIN